MFWSIGITMLTQCYSYRGLDAIAALNISNTISHLFMTVMFTLGNVVGIMLGNLLGAEQYDRAREYCPQLMALAFVSSLVMGGVLLLAAPWTPRLYNTTEPIIALAAGLMRIGALFMPVGALTNCTISGSPALGLKITGLSVRRRYFSASAVIPSGPTEQFMPTASASNSSARATASSGDAPVISRPLSP